MSLEGYKPLDLSSLQLPPLNLNVPISTNNVAKQILANTNWNLPSAVSLDSKGKEIKHKKSFVGRLMDALSIGNYAVSDFLLGGLKAHQSSSSDNPLVDALKSFAMGAKGFDEGILASLKGTFGNDDIANDPTGKNHFGDVLLQATSKGRAAIDPNSDMPLDERKKIIRNAYISGIPSDVLLDPLNLIGAGEIKGLARLFKSGKVSEEATQKAAEIASDGSKLPDIENKAPELSIKPPIPEGTELNRLPQKIVPNNFDPDTFDFVTQTGKLPTAALNEAIPNANKIAGYSPPKIELPKAIGRLSSPKTRQKIGGVMLQDAIKNGNWDLVKSKLAAAFPGMDLSQTTKYINHLESMPNAIEGLKRVARNRINFISAIDRVLEHDFNQAGRASMPEGIPPESLNKIPESLKSGSLKPPVGEMKSSENVVSNKAAKGLSALKNAHEFKAFANIIKKYSNQIETGIFPGIKNLDHFQQAIDSGKTVKWSGPKQVNMWQSILNKIPYAGPGKYRAALRVLEIAEQHFMNLGHTPYSASKSSEAVPLRLSEVIKKIGLENLAAHPDHTTTLLRSALAGGEMSSRAKKAAEEVPDLAHTIDSAVGEAKAASAVNEADAVKHGIDSGAATAVEATRSGQSEARIAEDINLASKTARDIAKLSGAGPVGSSMAGSILKNIFNQKTPVETAINRGAVNSKTALSTGTLRGFNNAPAITNALQHELDSASPSVLGQTIGPNSRVLDWLGARFNAAYKNADMRPIYLQEAATARASVAKRAEVWNKAVRQFGKDPDMWNRALHAAQGRYIPAVGSPESELAKLIQSNIENLVGSSGLRAGAELEYSVAGRAQILMKELNANLRRYGLLHEFTRNKITNETGIVDYSNGIDWLHSWESWKVNDPLKFMLRFQNAVENTVREANMFNEIAARWGSKTKGNGLTAVIDHPRLAEFYFTPEHASQIRTFMKSLEDLKKPNSKLMRQLDNVLSKWKSSVTIYMPSHHIRNMIGDTYMNWLAGVNSAKPYSQALKVMKSQKGRYDSIEDLGKLTSPNSVLKAIERMRTGEQAGEKGTNIVLTMKNGQHVTNDMIYTAAFQKGLLPNARVLEDLTDDSNIIERFRPLGGKGQAVFQHASEYREHAIRLAHFIDMLSKSSKSFPNAVEDATRAVRKWHPDGMDLTSFERTVMRRVFPFYSWTRKAIPLMVESLVMAPGKVVVYPKVMGGLVEGLNGGYGTSDPFPVDQLFPQWIRDKGIGPILGSAGNYTILNPSNPTLDLASEFSNPLRGIGSMLNPALRIPAEELTKTQMATGAPITSQADYITNQLPGISTVGRVTNIGIGGPTAKFDKQGGPNIAALINLLTAAGVLNTGPYQKQAQFELRDYLKGK